MLAEQTAIISNEFTIDFGDRSEKKKCRTIIAGMKTVATGLASPESTNPKIIKAVLFFLKPAITMVEVRKKTDSEKGRNIKIRLGIEAKRSKFRLVKLNNVASQASAEMYINPFSRLIPTGPR